MSQQRKIPVEEMIRIVELYLSGKIGFTSAYQEAGVSDEAFRLFRYKTGCTPCSIAVNVRAGQDGVQSDYGNSLRTDRL